MSKEIKVAIFAIVTITIFILGINFLKGVGFLDKRVTYYAVFEEVSGLRPSDPVLINGYQVGKISSLKLQYEYPNQGKVIATMDIDRDIQIPVTTTAILFSADFLGEMNVKLIMSDTMVFHNEGDTINTNIEGTLFEELGGEITPLTEKLSATLDNVNGLFDFEEKSKGSINYTVEAINNAIDTYTALGEDFGKLQNQLAAQLQTIDMILVNVSSTTNVLEKNSENIDASIENVADLTEKLNRIDIQQTVSNIDSLIVNFNKITTQINEGDNSIHALLYQREIYDNLDAATKDLDLLLEDLRLNPHRYVHFSVFGKKNK